jgi:gas vesicle protein
MNATERRILSCEALAFYHAEHMKKGVEALKEDGLREKLNDVAKTFIKTAKLIEKKKAKVPCACPKSYTKKEWKALIRELKGSPKEDDEVEDEDEDAEETESEEDEKDEED